MAKDEEPPVDEETVEEPEEEAAEETEEEEAEAEVPQVFGAYRDDGSLNPAYGDPVEVAERVREYKEEHGLLEGEEKTEGEAEPEGDEEGETEEVVPHNYAADEIVNQPPPSEPGVPAQVPGEPVEEDDEEAGSAEDEPSSEETEGEGEDRFDPSEHTVAEVQAHLADKDQTEIDRVKDLEEQGQARKGIMEY